MEGKTCTKCGEWKLFEGFPKRKTSKDGYRNECKLCISQYKKDYYTNNIEKRKEWRKKYYHENREEALKQAKEYKENHKEQYKISNRKSYERNKKQWLENRKIRRKENFESYSQKQKEYREKNKERIKEWRKEHYKNNYEKYYQAYLKRKSYKKKIKYSPFQRKQILDRDNWKCQNCGCKVHDRSTGNWNTPNKAHIDHIIPISKGGDSEPNNLQTLCRTCNLSKQDKVELQLSLF